MSVPQNALFDLLFSLPNGDNSYDFDSYYVHVFVVFCILNENIYFILICHVSFTFILFSTPMAVTKYT